MADLVGREVLKKFGRKSFKGKIDKFGEDEGWYHGTPSLSALLDGVQLYLYD